MRPLLAIFGCFALFHSSPALAGESVLDVITTEAGRAELNRLTRSEESFNRVTLLHLGKNSQPARIRALHEARESIFMDVPYWFSDEEGRLAYDVLAEKIQDNPELDLRVLFDWATPAQSDDFWEKGMIRNLTALARGNLLKWNMPEWHHRWSPLLLKNHMHDKMIVVDSRKLIMGGMNIADTYLHGGLTSEGWHDTDIQIDGPAAADASKLFLKTWEVTKYLSDRLHNQLPGSQKKFRQMFQDYYYNDSLDFAFRNMGMKFKAHFPLEDEFAALERVKREATRPDYTASVRLIYDNPLFETDSKNRQTLAYLLKHAKVRVRLFSPYLTITDAMEDILVEAAGRVPVEIITNSALAHDLGKIPFTAAVSHFPRLMDAGVKIYEWQGHKPLQALEKQFGCQIPRGEWLGNTLHTKAVMVDGAVTVLGSNNMNTRSETCNSEIMALMIDPKLTSDMEEVFLSDLDLDEDRQVTCGSSRIPRPRRVQEVKRAEVDRIIKKGGIKIRIFRHLQEMM